MNIGSFLNWWEWVILAAVPPGIVLLYFLKLRRQPLEVPSTYLWKKSIEDLHVNSFWQKMRQSLLLFLQLAFVAVIALALLRPFWQGSHLAGHRSIFLVDNSASMSAADIEPGSRRTRLDEAKQRIGELIEEMSSDDSAMIISFSSSARVEQHYTESRSELQHALAAIPQTNRQTSLEEALHVAAVLANPKKSGDKGGIDNPYADAVPADLYIFSDGQFPDVPNFSLGNLRPIFVPLGNVQSNNLGVTAFSVRRNEDRDDKLQAYYQISNFGSEQVTTDLELYHNNGQEPVDAKRVQIKPGESAQGVFELNDIDEGTLRLKISARDVLAIDNEAFALIGSSRRTKAMLVTPGNEQLTFALGTRRMAQMAEVVTFKPEDLAKAEVQETLRDGTFDLVIFDRCQPAEMPQANTLFIGRLPPVGWPAAEKVSTPVIIDTDHAHPIMQSIELGDVLIGESLALQVPAGGTKLIDSHKGTLFAIAPREGYQDAVLGFALIDKNEQGEMTLNTNWHLNKLSFPLFVFNAVSHLGSHASSQSATVTRPGQMLEIHIEVAGDQVAVKLPDGRLKSVSRGKQGKFQFADTDQLGIYEVRNGEKIVERFAVNLLDRAESNLRPRAKDGIKIGYTPVAAQSGWEPARIEGWRWLAMGALVLLLGEWYIYNRRVYL